MQLKDSKEEVQFTLDESFYDPRQLSNKQYILKYGNTEMKMYFSSLQREPVENQDGILFFAKNNPCSFQYYSLIFP